MTATGAATVPGLPPLPEALLEEHRDVHAEVETRIDRVDVAVAALFRRLQRRITVEAMANAAIESAAIPARRRWLSPDLVARVGASGMALRHVDARLEMRRRNVIGDLVSTSSPSVLHALAECRSVHGRETNAGLIRATPTKFHDTRSNFTPPSADQCRGLLAAAIDLANRAPAPAVARAGWLCLMVMAIHPFVDGNGRTARLLHQLIASSELPGGWDWATIEYWAAHRPEYIAALRASTDPSFPDYRGDLIEPEHFMQFAVVSSIRAADRVQARLAAIDDAWTSEWESHGPDHRLIEVAVWADGTATLDELAELLPDPRGTAIVNGLVRAERLCWGAGGFVRLGADHPLRALS